MGDGGAIHLAFLAEDGTTDAFDALTVRVSKCNADDCADVGTYSVDATVIHDAGAGAMTVRAQLFGLPVELAFTADEGSGIGITEPADQGAIGAHVFSPSEVTADVLGLRCSTAGTLGTGLLLSEGRATSSSGEVPGAITELGALSCDSRV